MGMRDRCRNPNTPIYKYYGGRGIKVCARWDSYDNFLEDMGVCPDGLSIDRIDNDGDYTPENCRWTDQKTQTRNSRRGSAYSAFGETKRICEWAEDSRCVVSLNVLDCRIRMGWTMEKAITKPKQTLEEHNNLLKSVRHLVTPVRGENVNTAKLVASDVTEIRKRLNRGIRPKDIAQQFAVCESTVSMIKLNKIWKHVQ